MTYAMQNTVLETIRDAWCAAPTWLAALIDAGVVTDRAAGSLPESYTVTSATAGHLVVYWTGAADAVAVSVTGSGTAHTAILGGDGVAYVVCTDCVDGDVIDVVADGGSPTVSIAASIEAHARVTLIDAGDVIDAPCLLLDGPTITRDYACTQGAEENASVEGVACFGSDYAGQTPDDFFAAMETVGLTMDACLDQSSHSIVPWLITADTISPPVRADRTGHRPGEIMIACAWSLEAQT